MTQNPLPTPSEPVGPSAGLDTLLTAEQVAARWQVSSAQVYRLAKNGALPVVRICRYRRFRRGAVEQWEQAGGGGSE
jgi:excisionase family DNA binding protein